MTGLSRSQVTRLIRSLHGQRAGPGDGLSATAFRRTLHTTDIELLASVDEAHETLSGSGDTAHSGAGTPGLQTARVCAAGRHLRRSPV